MVSSAPMSSQNVVVWTLLIKQALSENLPNLAFTLFNNMKRRGFQPNERTYATIFSGYNQLPELTDKQWDRVTGIWNQYQSFLEVAKLQDAHTRSSQSLVSPYVPYFEMLGKRGEYERLMEIFQSMDVDGPFAPDKFVYTTVLLQIGQRRYMSGVNGATSTASDDALIQNAQNTIAIADRMRETSAFDSFALSAILRGLMKGTDEHRQYGYDLLADVFGATPDNANFLESTTTELDHRLLDLVLELCCTMEKYDLVLDLFSKLKSSNKLKSLLTRSHMDYVLDSISFLAARSIPTSSEIDPSTPEPPPTSTKYSNEAMSVLEFMLHEGYGGHSMDILPNRGTYTRVERAKYKLLLDDVKRAKARLKQEN
ncbi:hypothetical protein FRB99_000661 [Tulasnella sp. 403]|nr:hypothetical protein FRB99_000661 [Tulasnella sp. 403]